MKLYLDDDSAKAALVVRLKGVGHQVAVPTDVGLSGAADTRQMLHAVLQDHLILTRNYDDFEDLHLLIQATRGQHPGILAVRYDNDPNRDMKDADMVRAIRNLEQSGVPIVNEFHSLNHWR